MSWNCGNSGARRARWEPVDTEPPPWHEAVALLAVQPDVTSVVLRDNALAVAVPDKHRPEVVAALLLALDRLPLLLRVKLNDDPEWSGTRIASGDPTLWRRDGSKPWLRLDRPPVVVLELVTATGTLEDRRPLQRTPLAHFPSLAAARAWLQPELAAGRIAIPQRKFSLFEARAFFPDRLDLGLTRWLFDSDGTLRGRVLGPHDGAWRCCLPEWRCKRRSKRRILNGSISLAPSCAPASRRCRRPKR